MENKFGMNKDEFEEWMHSDEYKAWQEAIGGTGWAGRNTDLNKNTDSQTQLRQSIDELNETIQNATGGNSSSVPNSISPKNNAVSKHNIFLRIVFSLLPYFRKALKTLRL